MRKFMRFLPVVVWAATLYVAMLWVLNPEDPQYEPITFILGLLSVAIGAVLAWKPAARWVKEQKRTVHLPASVGEQLLNDHKKVLQSLNEKNVEYILIGGFTGLFYGRVRHTHDLDVWIGHDADNHQRLKEAFQALGFDTSIIGGAVGGISPPFVRLGTAPIDLYLQKSMSGTDFYSFYKRRKVFVVDDLPISVMSQRDNRLQTSYKFDPSRLQKT